MKLMLSLLVTGVAAVAGFSTGISYKASINRAFCPTRGPWNTVSLQMSDTMVNGQENNQAKYGKSLPEPNTYVGCGRCQSFFYLTEEDLGKRGKGCHVECSTCGNTWFQSRDKLFSIRDGFELIPLPQFDIDRIAKNLEAGRRADFMGESKLYVGNLDFQCDEDALVEMFSKAGDVGEVSIVRDNDGKSRGFAFITMITEEGGENGRKLDGEMLLGRSVQVREPNN